jgi:hypothetical protein
MSKRKFTYEELEALLKRVYKTTRVESALGCEWANYPIEVFDEVVDVVTELELELKDDKE